MSESHLVQVTTCQLCGSARARKLFEEPPHTVQRCTDCGLVFVTPRLAQTELRAVYGDHYWKSDTPRTRGYSDYAGDEHLYLKTFRRRLALLRSVASRCLKVLDVGCAAGFFLRVMRENGHEVRGVEPSAAIAAHARRHLGDAMVHVGTLDDLPPELAGFEPRSFDLVTLWDVVEHVVDPQALLRRAHALLKPGGTLILETQNVDSAFARLLGRRWHHYKHQEHLYHFNRATVQTLLAQSGFEVVRNTASYGGKYVSLSFIAERVGRVHQAISALLRPLARACNVAFYVNLRDEMVVIARPLPTGVAAGHAATAPAGTADSRFGHAHAPSTNRVASGRNG